MIVDFSSLHISKSEKEEEEEEEEEFNFINSAWNRIKFA